MALTIYESLEQGTDEWLEARRGIVTASTVGKLLTSTGKVANNDTSRGLIETLAIERITGRVEYIHPTRDMQRGTILEPFARDLYAQHYGEVQEVGFMRDDCKCDAALGYSPDGLVGDDGLIEIKSRSPRIHARTIADDRIPAANMAQLQAGLLVSSREWIDYVSYSPGLPLYVKRVKPSTPWFNAIRAAVHQAEEDITEYENDYCTRAVNYPATEYHDPFAEEDIIIG